MMDDSFEKLVTDALSELPSEFKEQLNNVEIVIEDNPTLEQRRKLRLHNGMLLLGFYEGIPQTKRGGNYSLVLPDKITIFKNPILHLYQTEENIKQHIQSVVYHEIGHHFGLSDATMQKIGK